MINIDPVLERSPALKELIVQARKLSMRRDFEGARRHYKSAMIQAEMEFGERSADYGLVVLEIADFFDSFGRDIELYGLRCKIRDILKTYAASYMSVPMGLREPKPYGTENRTEQR